MTDAMSLPSELGWIEKKTIDIWSQLAISKVNANTCDVTHLGTIHFTPDFYDFVPQFQQVFW